MQLRFRLCAIGSALALAAGLGFAFAGPALATDNVQLCFLNPASNGGGVYCALGLDMDNSPVSAGAENGGSYWDVPTSGTHQISLAADDPKVCMEVNASQSDDIRTNPCDALDSEEWSVITSDVTIGSNTYTSYYFESQYGSDLCLTAAPSDQYDVYANTCDFSDPYQNWVPRESSTGPYL
jgi:hypothetical protein